MPFADIDEKPNFESKFRKTEFIDLATGMNIIRIIDAKPTKVYTHYVRGAYIECLGDDCPVCSNNKKLIAENPDNFRTIGGYSAKSERFIINVLDRTPVKICPKCGVEIKKSNDAFPPACPKCGQFINTVLEQPLNKVKVLAKGKELFNQLNVVELSTLNANKEIIGLQNFDVMLFVTGTGRDTKITAIPQPTSTDVVKVSEDSLFDTKHITLKLNPEEIDELLKGVNIRDILVARKSDKETKDLKNTGIEINNDVKKQVDGLFG